jgi:isopenicillin N synthase-like dioxygenase
MNKVFVAENMKGSKRRFALPSQSKSKFKRERNAFRSFMDGGSVEQKTTEDYAENNEV